MRWKTYHRLSREDEIAGESVLENYEGRLKIFIAKKAA